MKNYQKFVGNTTSAKSLFTILENSGYKIELPIDIKNILKIVEINVKKAPDFTKTKVTGSISLKKEELLIWVNPIMNQTHERERFTLAHELGHFMLHIAPRFKAFINKEISDEVISLNRDDNWDKTEMEANSFAVQLLMPERNMLEEIEKFDNELSKDEKIKILAKTFLVSEIAIRYRIKTLGVKL